MTVSDNTIGVEGLSEFFKSVGKKGLNVSKKMSKKVSKNPGRALEISANVGTALAFRSPKKTLPTLTEVIKFYHTGHDVYLGKFI